MNKNILIIGSSGFIGNNLSKYFTRKKFNVKKITRKNFDIKNLTKLKSYFQKINFKITIIFCSSKTYKNEKNKNTIFSYNKTIINNIIEINKIFENKINKFIFLSTIEIYGINKKKKINEKTRVQLLNNYSRSKFFSELKLKKNIKNKLLILRLPGIYGKGDRFESTIGSIYKKIINNSPVAFNTYKLNYRTYLHIDDVCKIIGKFLNINQKNQIINLVSENYINFFDLSKIFNRYFINRRKKLNFSFYEDKKNSNYLVFNNKILKKYIKNYKFITYQDGLKKYS